MQGNAQVAVSGSDKVLRQIIDLTGDYTGTLHLLENQRMTLDKNELQTSLFVYPGAQMTSPPVISVPPNVTLLVNGSLCGAQNISLHGILNFGSLGKFCNGPQGIFNFSTIVIYETGILSGSSSTLLEGLVCRMPGSQVIGIAPNQIHVIYINGTFLISFIRTEFTFFLFYFIFFVLRFITMYSSNTSKLLLRRILECSSMHRYFMAFLTFLASLIPRFLRIPRFPRFLRFLVVLCFLGFFYLLSSSPRFTSLSSERRMQDKQWRVQLDGSL